jgi:hypothetical protein
MKKCCISLATLCKGQKVVPTQNSSAPVWKHTKHYVLANIDSADGTLMVHNAMYAIATTSIIGLF